MPLNRLLLTAALWSHKPARAKEFYDLASATGLTPGKPFGGWTPGKWA